MEFMQKYTKEDGAVGIEDLDRWPADSNAVNFLSVTTSEPSMDDLKEVGATSITDCDDGSRDTASAPYVPAVEG